MSTHKQIIGINDTFNLIKKSVEPLSPLKEAITNFKEYISNEILALSIEFEDNNGELIDINDHEVKVEIEVSK